MGTVGNARYYRLAQEGKNFDLMTPLRYLSLCSGIEAATTAWHSLGWEPVAFCEIDAFPSAVLAYHWPHVPNLKDMTKWRTWSDDMLAQVDILVGGTPCQAFSVAGLRNSLDDERGNLTLIYAHILDHIDTVRASRGLPPCICLWENVPGVLSTKDNAFGCFLGALAGEDEALVPSGKKWTNAGYVRGPQRSIAYRTLDAQFFGVAQRRRRVFVVASARDGFRPEEVLFIEQGVRRDTPPSREAGQEITPTLRAGAANGSPGHGQRSGDSRDELIVPCFWNGEQVTQTLDAVLAKGQTMPEKNRLPAVLVPDTSRTLLGKPNCSHAEDQESYVVHTATPTIHIVHGTQDPCTSEHTAFALGRNHGGENVVGITPVAYRVHGEHSTAMTGKGIANVADPVEVARCLDSSGGYATNQGGNVVAVAFHIQDQNSGRGLGCNEADISPTVSCRNLAKYEGSFNSDIILEPVAFAENQRGEVRETEQVNALTKGGGKPGQGYPAARVAMQVRRLTPTECARLQGFPDSHTRIEWRGRLEEDCPDGPQYKAYGNSMAVPCMAWLGRRIADFGFPDSDPSDYTHMNPTDFRDSDYADLLDPELLVPHYLLHCRLYYDCMVPIIEDHQFDLLARRLDAEWDATGHPHRHLIDRSALRSGGSYLTGKYPLKVIGAARHLLQVLQG